MSNSERSPIDNAGRSPVTNLTAVILAAGEGKRMRSSLPKVLHRQLPADVVVAGIAAAIAAGSADPEVVAIEARAVADRLVMVVGPDVGDLAPVVGADVRLVEQRERLGTGHALEQARARFAEFSELKRREGHDALEKILGGGTTT